MKRAWIERLFEFRLVRIGVGGFFVFRGAALLMLGRLYRGLDDFCWVLRVSDVKPLKNIAHRVVFNAIQDVRRTGHNGLVDSYVRERAATVCASRYSISGSGASDIFRDLIVLKKSTSAEKGVILLKYARTFSAVVALFDLQKLMARYTFVLEPCWAGFSDPSILMFFTPGHPVFVQCFTEQDYQFISRVGAPFVPVRLGPADWVDAEIFSAPTVAAKLYDLVMVANWAAHKRHLVLFKALAKVRNRRIRVLLVGFPWGGRTADDIRRDASEHLPENIETTILENIPQRELAGYVRASKVFVFLSRKEGDNKALVEAMFADVPAIVYDKTIGGATSRINPETGVLASDAELAERIVFMLDHSTEFRPRKWALEHTGSAAATRVLEKAISDALRESGIQFSGGIAEKANAPNLAYKDPGCVAAFMEDYEFILGCLRNSVVVSRRARAQVTA